MRRALGALVALSIASACAGQPPKPMASPATDACNGNEPVLARDDSLGPEPEWGIRISRIEIQHGQLPRGIVSERVRVRALDSLDAEAIRADVTRLMALEAVENVRVEIDGSVLRYLVEPRPLIQSVVFRGSKPPAGRWLPLTAGELYDPVRIARMRGDLERNLVERGHLVARVETRQAKRPSGVDVCIVVRAGPEFVLDRVELAGNLAVKDTELLELIGSHSGKVNRAGKPFRQDLLEADFPRLLGHYYDRGFLTARIDEPVVRRDPARGKVSVTIPIVEGRRYHLGRIHFVGVPAALAVRYLKTLELAQGSLFARDRVARALERLGELVLRERGSMFEIETETDLREETGSVDVRLTLRKKP